MPTVFLSFPEWYFFDWFGLECFGCICSSLIETNDHYIYTHNNNNNNIHQQQHPPTNQTGTMMELHNCVCVCVLGVCRVTSFKNNPPFVLFICRCHPTLDEMIERVFGALKSVVNVFLKLCIQSHTLYIYIFIYLVVVTGEYRSSGL